MSGVQVSERQQARRENWRLIRRRPGFIIGVFIVLVWMVCAIFGDMITPHNPLDFRTSTHLSPNWSFPFGTDEEGRDVLSRVMAGARDVMKVAPLGRPSGCALRRDHRHVHGVLRRLARHRARPDRRGVPRPTGGSLRLLAVSTLGNSSTVVIGVVAVLFTPIVARTVRSAVHAERDLDYVTSAKLRGESLAFVMFREILPNCRARSSSSSQCASVTPCSRSRRCRSWVPAPAAVARLGRTGQRGVQLHQRPASGGRRCSRRWPSPAS